MDGVRTGREGICTPSGKWSSHESSCLFRPNKTFVLPTHSRVPFHESRDSFSRD